MRESLQQQQSVDYVTKMLPICKVLGRRLSEAGTIGYRIGHQRLAHPGMAYSGSLRLSGVV